MAHESYFRRRQPLAPLGIIGRRMIDCWPMPMFFMKEVDSSLAVDGIMIRLDGRGMRTGFRELNIRFRTGNISVAQPPFEC